MLFFKIPTAGVAWVGPAAVIAAYKRRADRPQRGHPQPRNVRMAGLGIEKRRYDLCRVSHAAGLSPFMILSTYGEYIHYICTYMPLLRCRSRLECLSSTITIHTYILFLLSIYLGYLFNYISIFCLIFYIFSYIYASILYLFSIRISILIPVSYPYCVLGYSDHALSLFLRCRHGFRRLPGGAPDACAAGGCPARQAGRDVKALLRSHGPFRCVLYHALHSTSAQTHPCRFAEMHSLSHPNLYTRQFPPPPFPPFLPYLFVDL